LTCSEMVNHIAAVKSEREVAAVDPFTSKQCLGSGRRQPTTPGLVHGYFPQRAGGAARRDEMHGTLVPPAGRQSAIPAVRRSELPSLLP
jgi:hypothetical protein